MIFLSRYSGWIKSINRNVWIRSWSLQKVWDTFSVIKVLLHPKQVTGSNLSWKVWHSWDQKNSKFKVLSKSKKKKKGMKEWGHSVVTEVKRNWKLVGSNCSSQSLRKHREVFLPENITALGDFASSTGLQFWHLLTFVHLVNGKPCCDQILLWDIKSQKVILLRHFESQACLKRRRL